MRLDEDWLTMIIADAGMVAKDIEKVIRRNTDSGQDGTHPALSLALYV